MTQTAETPAKPTRTRKTGKIVVYSKDTNGKLSRVFADKTFKDIAEIKKHVGSDGVLAALKQQENIDPKSPVNFVVAREVDSFTADIVQPAPKTVIK